MPMTLRPSVPQAVLLACACCVLLVIATAHGAASWVSFLADDWHIVQVARRLDALSPFVDPRSYQHLSAAHFTPTVVALYQVTLAIAGLDPMAFLILQALLFACLAVVVCRIVAEQAGTPLAAWIFGSVGLLGFSSWATLLTRFYTAHYVLGALCTALAIWFLVYRRATGAAVWLPLALLGIALASKEVYVMALPLLAGWAIHHKRWFLAASLMSAAAAYLLWRTSMIGISLGGRNNVGVLRDLLDISAAQWQAFLSWFVQQRIGLAGLTLAALLARPREMLRLGMWAVPFALPALAAPHGFRDPGVHADRLFFAFDVALLAVVAVVLAGFSKRLPAPRGLLPGAVAVLALAFLPLHQWLAGQHAQAAMGSNEYRVVAGILERVTQLAHRGQQAIVLVPEGQMMGALWADARGPAVTAYCDEALAMSAGSPDRLIAPDASGRKWLDAAQLAQRCQPFALAPVVKAMRPPRYAHGVLSWNVSAAEAEVQVGIAFPERAMVLWIPVLEQRLAAPFPGERFSIVTRRGSHWWRGAPSVIAVDAP